MRTYSDIIYNEWKSLCISEREQVVRGRIIGVSKGISRDIWTISSDKRYTFFAPKDIRHNMSKADIVVVFLKKDNKDNYWLSSERYMIISKSLKTKAYGDLSIYPRNDRREKDNYYLQILNDEKTMSYIRVRAKVLSLTRHYLEKRNYLENNISNIQRHYFGGNAMPFITHVNYLHKDCYLKANSQIPFVIYLAGGVERMYEISEYYRNGGIDESHTVPYNAVEIVSSYTLYPQIKEMAKDFLYYIASSLEKTDIALLDKGFIEKLKHSKEKDFREIVKDCPEKKYEALNNKEITYEQSKEIYKILKQQEMVMMEELTFLDFLPDSKSPFIKRMQDDSNYLYRGYGIVNGINILEYFEGETNSSYIMGMLLDQNENNGIRYNVLHNALELGIPRYSYITISIDRIISFFIGETNLQKYKLII